MSAALAALASEGLSVAPRVTAAQPPSPRVDPPGRPHADLQAPAEALDGALDATPRVTPSDAPRVTPNYTPSDAPSDTPSDAPSDGLEGAPDDAVPSALTWVEQLLRAPDAALGALVDSPEGASPATLRTLVLTVALGAGLFGGVLGAARGPLQSLAAGVKLPVVLLVTLMVCVAPFVALARIAGTRLTAASTVSLVLGASARLALVLAGLAPVLWLVASEVRYHSIIVTAVAACAVAGAAALRFLFQGLERVKAPLRVGLAWVLLFSLVGAQSGWCLRPFVVRPRTASPPIVRALEGDFFEAISGSARAAVGRYDARSALTPR